MKSEMLFAIFASLVLVMGCPAEEAEPEVKNYGLVEEYTKSEAHRYCEANGNTLKGNDICVLRNGTEAEIWAYFTGEYEYRGIQLTEREKDWLSRGYRFDKDGWYYVHIEGTPFERGFQNGYLMADVIYDMIRISKFDGM